MDSTSLDLIAEQFAVAVRSGDAPSIDEFISRYPNAPPDLRSLLQSVAMLEGLKEPSPPLMSPTPTISELDDYTIVREIGRGGMGIVFEAIHQSLGRRVAIKVLSSGWLGDTKHLARFRREARAAAKLRHTNIVPVFGVGQFENHHYYVMDFIDGMSLRQFIDSISGSRDQGPSTIDQAEANTDRDLGIEISENHDRSQSLSPNPDVVTVQTDGQTDHRWVSEIGAKICDALQYAHTQGVLHRDIKPANLLIDQRGEVWIADFGLAKLVEQQPMTATGDVMGTPQYMPPESFEGIYDVRSEVYAVGLTLYELLTQKPAIEGKSPADTIRKASSGVITRPRTHRSDLHRDLETVVLKCLSHDPDSRYATVGDVRDDLRRFLADRPIAARRAGMIERTVRWSRREPTIASLTFATFGLLLALAVVSAIGYLRTKNALDVASVAKRSTETSLVEKSAALGMVEQQRQRAERNLQVALTAFDSIMQNISSRGLDADSEFDGEVADTTSPNVTPADAKLLQSLLGFFDELGANNSEDLLAESAVAARRAGEIYQRLGQLRGADRAYSEALDRYRTLSEKNPGTIDFVIARAELQNELTVIAGLRGQRGRADQMYRQTIDLLTDSESAMNSMWGRFQYARAHRLFASIRARSRTDGLGTRPRNRAAMRSRRPNQELKNIRIEEKLRATDLAIAALDQLTQEFPDEIQFRVELARAFRDRAKVASIAQQRQASESAIDQSIELFDRLLAENTDSNAIRYELAVTLSSTEAFGLKSRLRTVRAAELSKQLLKDSPNQPRYLTLRAHTLTTLAKFQQRGGGNPEQAVISLNEAIAIYDSLAASSPESSLYMARRSRILESKSDLQQRQGKTEAAIATLEQAVEQLQRADGRQSSSPGVRVQVQRMKQKWLRLKNASLKNE